MAAPAFQGMVSARGNLDAIFADPRLVRRSLRLGGGMTVGKRTLIAARDPISVSEIRAYIERSNLQMVGVVDPGMANPFEHLRSLADVAIMTIADLRRFRRHNPPPVSPRSLAVRLVAILDLSEILDLQRDVDLVGGVIFRRPNTETVARSLELATMGYCVVPGDLLGDLSPDKLRLELLEDLSDEERRTLDLLGHATDNRAIARLLDVSEARAKTLVRSVLTKLRLRNRTAGAVFAARRLTMSYGLPNNPD